MTTTELPYHDVPLPPRTYTPGAVLGRFMEFRDTARAPYVRVSPPTCLGRSPCSGVPAHPGPQHDTACI